LLRGHVLLGKVGGTHRYQLTDTGRRIVTALLTARQANVEQLAQLAGEFDRQKNLRATERFGRIAVRRTRKKKVEFGIRGNRLESPELGLELGEIGFGSPGITSESH
jgi:hypothetical protein